MDFNRKLWSKVEFSEKDLPNWPCPKCYHEVLKFISGPNHNPSYDEFLDDVQIFTGFLLCRNCGDWISIIGDWTLERDNSNWNHESESPCELDHWLSPKYFYPNLRLFNLQRAYPPEICEALNKSFATYFSDIFLSATMLRAAVEKLLDHKTFGAIPRKDDKGNFLPLENRINLLPEEKKQQKDLLIEIKWIGNYGAHFNQRLNRDSLLIALEIFQSIIEAEFLNRNEHINSLAKELKKRRTQSNDN
jgi:hypothetical protein